MTEQKDFFEKKISQSTPVPSKKTSSSTSWIIWILIVVVLALGGYLVRDNFISSDVSQPSAQTSLPFEIGSPVSLGGTLSSNGDIINYTHVLVSPEYGMIGLKSRTLNLGDYNGDVEIAGTVEKYYQDMPIVEVSSLSGGNVLATGDTVDIAVDTVPGVYLSQAGLYFAPDFFEHYMLLNEGENGQIKIKDLDTDEEFSLDYFKCNPAKGDENCTELNKTFSNIASKSFSTSNNDRYYKQPEVNSWFVSNGNWWGYFLNDLPEETVMKLKDYLLFVNENVIKDWIRFSAPKLCKDQSVQLVKETSHSTSLKTEGILVDIKGIGNGNQEVECSVIIDFSLPDKGRLVSFRAGDVVSISTGTVATGASQDLPSSTGATSSVDQSVTIPTTWNPNVKQFPTNLEKALTYKSSRGGYAMALPSSNISYAVASTDQDFGQAGVRCNYVLKVIKYADAANLETSPALKVYECSFKNGFTLPSEQYVLKELGDKKFVVEVQDPSWVDFANQIQISSLE